MLKQAHAYYTGISQAKKKKYMYEASRVCVPQRCGYRLWRVCPVCLVPTRQSELSPTWVGLIMGFDSSLPKLNTTQRSEDNTLMLSAGLF